MPDNIIEVKIQGDQAGVDATLAEVAAAVETQTQAMVAGFEQMTAASLASTEAIVAATKATEHAVEEEAESIGASLKEAGNHFVEFAEQAKIAQLGAFSTFGAIGGIFGGGLLVAGIGEAVNKVRELDVEMEHLSVATGVPIEKIAELKSTMEQFGAPADAIDKVLVRLSRSMLLASQGAKQQSAAFKNLGVDTSSWADKLPTADEVLLQIAQHMEDSTRTTQDMGSAMQVAGRGITGLTGVLHEGREELEKAMDSHKAYGEAVKASADSALKLTALEHDLGEVFKNLALSILPPVVTGIKVLYSGLEYAAEGMDGLIATVIWLGSTINDYFIGTIKTLTKVLTGDLSEANKMAGKTFASIAENWKTYNDTITGLEQDTKDKVDKIWSDPVKKPPTGDTDIVPDQAVLYDPVDKAREKDIESEAAHSRAITQLREEDIKEQFNLGQINSQQRLAQLNAVAAIELAQEQGFLAQKKALYDKNDPNAPEAFAAIAGESVKLNDQFNATKQKNNTEFANEWKRTFLKTVDEIIHAQEEDLKLAAKVATEKEKLAAEAAAVQAKVAVLREQESQRMANQEIEDERKAIDTIYKLHEITEAQKIALTQQTYDREYALQIASVNRQIAELDVSSKTYLIKKQELENQLSQIQSKAESQRQQSDTQSLLLLQSQYTKFFDVIEQSSYNQFQLMIQGQRTFAQGMANIGLSIVANWEQTLLKLVLKTAEHQVVMLAMHTAEKQGEVISTAAAETEKGAIETAGSLKSIVKAAAKAASNTYATVSEIPFVGPVLAPIAAAGAFTAVLAFGASVSAEQGALLPNRETLVHAHPEEMMLPRPISKGLQNAIDGGTLNQKQQQPVMHFNYNHYDQGGRLTDGQINENSDRLIKQMRTKINRMGIGGKL